MWWSRTGVAHRNLHHVSGHFTPVPASHFQLNSADKLQPSIYNEITFNQRSYLDLIKLVELLQKLDLIFVRLCTFRKLH